MGPRAGLDGRKISSPPGFDLVVCLQSQQILFCTAFSTIGSYCRQGTVFSIFLIVLHNIPEDGL